MDIASWIFNIFACVFVITGGSVWAAVAYSRCPKFIVGVPPSLAEQKLKGISKENVGSKSIVGQFKHRPACFSINLPNQESLLERDLKRLFSDKLRCRTINLTQERKAILPVVTENYGGRAARDYILGIQLLNPHVHVIDIITESLIIDTFYANRADLVENRDLKSVDTRIIEAYDNYMEIGEQYGDVIFLKGNLESGTYELVLLKILVEPQIDKFVVGYALDCSDGWISKKAYFQGFVVSG